MKPNYTWSYSSLDLFKQCPQKYYRLRVVKDVKDPPTEHLTYGLAVHKAAEDYISQGTPIPEKFVSILQKPLDRLIAMEGEKHCELRLGLTQNLDEQDKSGIYWTKWLEDTGRLEAAISNGVWNKKPNFTCRQYCPVHDCEHNGKGH